MPHLLRMDLNSDSAAAAGAALASRINLRLCHVVICVLLVVTGPVHGSDIWAQPITLGAWKLDGPRGFKRWLVVHAVSSDRDPNFHIEVLQAKSGDPAWQFDRLVAHMAISDAALRRSIVGPSKQRYPYPEAYEAGYRSWLQSARPEVCATTVNECLAASRSQQPSP